MNRTKGMATALALAGLLLLPGLAAAQVDFGVRGGIYNDADAGFLGGELLVGISRNWYFNPNLEYVFVDDGSLYTANADFHYDFRPRASYDLWLGGGPAVIFSDYDAPPGCRRCRSEDDTEVGLNLLAGAGFLRGSAIRPYVQGKLIFSDNTEAAVAFGVRFH